jgi:hypothetical protein
MPGDGDERPAGRDAVHADVESAASAAPSAAGGSNRGDGTSDASES